MSAEPTRPPTPGWPRWPLLIVVACAVAVRIWSWSWAVQMTNDGVDFLWQAQRLLAGEVELMLRHPYHPLTATFIAGLSWITGDVLSAAVTVSVLSGAVIVIAAHDLARMAFPHLRSAGLFAAILAALHSRTVIYTSDVQSDGLFLALFLLAVRMAFAGIERGVCRRRLALAGLLSGLAYLTRPEGLFVALPVGLWALAAWRRSDIPRARIASGVAAFALVLIVVALPYVMFVHHTTGIWGISMKPSLSAVGLAESGNYTAPPKESPISSPKVRRAKKAPVQPNAPPDTPQPKQGSLSPLALVLTDSKSVTPASLAETFGLYVNTLRADVFVFAMVGLVILWGRRRRLAQLLICITTVWLALSAFHLVQSTYLSARHVMELVVLCLPLAGAAMASAWSSARQGKRPSTGLRCLVVLSLFAMFWSGVRPRHADHGPRLEALAWVRTQTAEDERIGVHRRKDGWYAQRSVLVVLTPPDEQNLASRMKRYQVRYLVFDIGRIQRHMPHWLEGGMREVRRFGEPGQAGEVIVLEAVPAEG